MRAMTASGTVPSTTAGRIRCLSASSSAPGWSDSARVDQHEAGRLVETSS